MMKILYAVVYMVLVAVPLYAVTIDRVDISGNRRIPASRLTPYLIKSGDEFDAEKINNSIKMLHGTGYFSEITVDANMEGNEFVITYIMHELPLVASVEYSGNKKLTEKTLNEKIAVKPEDTFNTTKIGYSIQTIINEYEKKNYYNVKVTHRLEYVNDTSVNVVFDIEEGDTSKVYNIWFYGNDSFTDETLRNEMQTKQKDFWSALNNSGALERSIMRIDPEMVKEFYRSKGYIDVMVSEPEIVFQENLERMNYILRVEEGNQYRISGINIKDNGQLFTRAELDNVTKLRPNDIFNVKQYRDDVESLIDLYKEKGYADAYVDDSMISVNKTLNHVELNYEIIPGEIYTINRIMIKGNVKTNDNVIRREFDLAEGDQYNGSLLKEAEVNLMRTGYFTGVRITEEKNGRYADIIVNVAEEERSGTFMFYIAYANELSGKLEVSKENLFGAGQSVSVSAEMAENRRDFKFDFYDPWVFDSKYSAGFGLYHFDRNDDYYDQKSFGGHIRVGHQLIKRYLFMSYTLGHDETYIEDVTSDASYYIKKQEGLSIKNYFTPSITFSALDNRMDPRDGVKASLNLEYAGTFLGGTTHTFTTMIDATYHHPLPYSVVFSAHGKIGQIWPLTDDDIPITDRYFLGGAYSIRGFRYKDISPVDAAGEQYGGNKMYQVNLELWRPIVEGSISVRGVVFYDMGMVYDDEHYLFSAKPRMSYGAGIRLLTPLGLMRLEYGRKIDKKEGESAGEFEFSIGNLY